KRGHDEATTARDRPVPLHRSFDDPQRPGLVTVSMFRAVRMGGRLPSDQDLPVIWKVIIGAFFQFHGKNRSSMHRGRRLDIAAIASRSMIPANEGYFSMSKLDDNKAVVGRWFTEFWGKTVNLGVIDEIAAPDMLLKYSLHEPRRGRADIKAFMTDFRAAFPDLNFWGTADLIAEGD